MRWGLVSSVKRCSPDADLTERLYLCSSTAGERKDRVTLVVVKVELQSDTDLKDSAVTETLLKRVSSPTHTVKIRITGVRFPL